MSSMKANIKIPNKNVPWKKYATIIVNEGARKALEELEKDRPLLAEPTYFRIKRRIREFLKEEEEQNLHKLFIQLLKILVEDTSGILKEDDKIDRTKLAKRLNVNLSLIDRLFKWLNENPPLSKAFLTIYKAQIKHIKSKK